MVDFDYNFFLLNSSTVISGQEIPKRETLKNFGF
jgi:hypothetical protein